MSSQLNILSEKEVRQIYGLPKLNPKQRSIYLEFTLLELELARKHRTPVTSAYFLLQLAYFKFKRQFFIFDFTKVAEDVAYLKARYFAGKTLPIEGIISKPIRLRQQRRILGLMKYRAVDQESREQLFDRACHLSTISASPHFIFRDLINWAEQKRIVLPGYSIIQRNIIGRSLTLERQRLEMILSKYLPEEYASRVDDLINEKVGYFYGLTWLEQEAPNFNPQSIRREIDRKEILRPLFEIADPLLQKLDISNENVSYYASLARHYTVGELRQFMTGIHHIYILAFIYHRYRECNDILAEAFKYYVRKYDTQAKQIVKDYFYQFRKEANEELRKIPVVLSLFVDNSISDDTPFIVVKNRVLDILNQEKILLLSDFIGENHVDEIELRWKHFEKIQKQISYNLRHIFKFLDFMATGESGKELIEAATAVKAIFSKGKSLKKVDVKAVPKGFIPQYLQSYIFKEGGFVASRYELLLYQSLSRQLQGGNISIKNSVIHRSLELDLIPLDYWRENKEQILKQVDLEKFLLTPEDLLDKLEKELEDKIKTVNQSILQGKTKRYSLIKSQMGHSNGSLSMVLKKNK
jgi:hypothetical protein